MTSYGDAYPSEAQRLKVLKLLIEKLTTSPSSCKVDFVQFTEECSLHLEDEGSDLFVDGEDVTEELARMLKKSRIVKWKGDQ